MLLAGSVSFLRRNALAVATPSHHRSARVEVVARHTAAGGELPLHHCRGEKTAEYRKKRCGLSGLMAEFLGTQICLFDLGRSRPFECHQGRPQSSLKTQLLLCPLGSVRKAR